MFVYTLQLEDNCWYVGSTTRPPERLAQHKAGNGSAWTSAHPPVAGFSSLTRVESNNAADARLQEDMEVKRLMQRHGIERVRGGSYAQTTLNDDAIRALQRELRHADDACLRCGRSSHWVQNCYATYDVSGNLIVDEGDESSDSSSSTESNYYDSDLSNF